MDGYGFECVLQRREKMPYVLEPFATQFCAKAGIASRKFLAGS
jgi:hypothetical protein